MKDKDIQKLINKQRNIIRKANSVSMSTIKKLNQEMRKINPNVRGLYEDKA